MSRPKLALLVVLALSLCAVPAVANAATLAVDDDGAQCPAAQFDTIQAAVDAAAPGDTVAVCPGVYVEGTGAVGSDALYLTGIALVLAGLAAEGETLIGPGYLIDRGHAAISQRFAALGASVTAEQR